MLKICFLVDAEADFYYNIPSPHISKSWYKRLKWNLNKTAGKIYRYPYPSRKGSENLMELFKKYNFPVSFTFVGHLYLEKCNGWPHFIEEKPKAGWLKKEWYYWDPASDYRKYPGLYLGDLIKREKNNKLFDFGLHAFSHEAYLVEDKKMIESSIKSAVKAANILGIKPVSYQGPWNMTEENTNKDLLTNVLKKNGIKIISYSGINYGLFQKKEFKIKPVFNKGKIKAVWISNYIEGTSKKEKVAEIIKQIKENINTNNVYCLAMHDFTWKRMKNLELIAKEIKELENVGKVEIKNMRQLL